MARFHPRGVAAAVLVLILFFAGAPSWAAAKPRPGGAASHSGSFQEQLARILRLVTRACEKIGNTLDPNGGNPPPPSNRTTSDIGNTLDPNG